MFNNVEVQLYKRPGTASYFIRVRLHSGVRHGLISYKDLDTDKRLSYNDLSRPISIIGGALAEYQIENYGDMHEPKECALAALEALRELLIEVKEKTDPTNLLKLGDSINAH